MAVFRVEKNRGYTVMFFERSEQGLWELDNKYGKVCHNLSYNIVGSRQDAEECVNDAYLGQHRTEKGAR